MLQMSKHLVINNNAVPVMFARLYRQYTRKRRFIFPLCSKYGDDAYF